jgi:hypothetical protein
MVIMAPSLHVGTTPFRFHFSVDFPLQKHIGLTYPVTGCPPPPNQIDGQTGSGKTFTMFGSEDKSQIGIVPRAAQ